MKKIFALAIALVMVLAIAAPAMAFTTVTKSDDPDYELDLYLVEYENDTFFGITTLPETDRGYAKNEIVAAVCEVTVPDGADAITPANYPELVFSGDNVTLDVTDNVNNILVSSNVNLDTTVPLDGNHWDGLVGGDLVFDITSLGDDDTYSFLFFAKVTDDEASLTATLVSDETDDADFGPEDEEGKNLVLGGDYEVDALADGDDWLFTISNDGDDLFRITTDDDFETKGLEIYAEGPDTDTDGALPADTDTDNGFYVVVGLAGDKLGFINFVTGTLVDEDSNLFDDLMEIYEDEFVAEFGFDYDLMGGVVDFDFFLDYAGSSDIEVSVDIAPWTAYVTVPDNIVVDPPKTGDAASILGFVMIVLAAAAVVAVRKVRA